MKEFKLDVYTLQQISVYGPWKVFNSKGILVKDGSLDECGAWVARQVALKA